MQIQSRNVDWRNIYYCIWTLEWGRRRRSHLKFKCQYVNFKLSDTNMQTIYVQDCAWVNFSGKPSNGREWSGLCLRLYVWTLESTLKPQANTFTVHFGSRDVFEFPKPHASVHLLGIHGSTSHCFHATARSADVDAVNAIRSQSESLWCSLS